MAFTCGQVTVKDWISDVKWDSVNPAHYGGDDSNPSATGVMYRMVRGDVSECHSASESDTQDLQMKCINMGITKSCHMMELVVTGCGTNEYGNPANSCLSYHGDHDNGDYFIDRAAAQGAWEEQVQLISYLTPI